jgi:hypothetical protein
MILLSVGMRNRSLARICTCIIFKCVYVQLWDCSGIQCVRRGFGETSGACSTDRLEQKYYIAEYRSIRHRYRVKPWIKNFYSTHLYLHFKGLQELNVKIIRIHVRNANHWTLCMPPIVMPLNVASACVPVRFWYQRRLHLWSSVKLIPL